MDDPRLKQLCDLVRSADRSEAGARLFREVAQTADGGLRLEFDPVVLALLQRQLQTTRTQ